MALKRGERAASRTPVVATDGFHVDTTGGRRLGELLVARNVVTKTQLVEALLQQNASGKRIGALLVELGALDERALAELLAEQMDVPLVDLRIDTPDPEAVRLLPETVARTVNAVYAFQLPRNRTLGDNVVFTATVRGRVLLRAYVNFTGATPIVKRWSSVNDDP